MTDVTSVSHHSPDTDMSGGDTEIFEVHLNSAKLLSAGRTCVCVCACVYMWMFAIQGMHTRSRRFLFDEHL